MDEKGIILIADDVELNRDVLQDIFINEYRTVLAENGKEAVECLEQYRDEIALVLLDERMPELDGFGVAEYMKNHGLADFIPIVMITGSEDYRMELKAFDMGVDDFIHKPFIPEIVMRRCKAAIELKRAHYDIRQRALKLEEENVYDTLTGFLRMKPFLQKADEELQKAEREQKQEEYAFVYCNIRNFKYYNVRYGTQAGDAVLKDLAEIIRGSAGEMIHSRFSDDHFVSLEHKEKSVLISDINHVVDEFHAKYAKVGLKLKTGVYYTKKETYDAAKSADLAKVACDAIRGKKGVVCVYDEGLAHDIEMESYVLQYLDEAIQNGYIKVYYQPVVRTISGKVCSMEALARWIDPYKGFLSPGDFIPVLERNRLITKLDLYMLREICHEMKSAELSGAPIVPVSFNLSRHDFVECDIFSEVEKIVLEYGIARDMINVEITESTVMDNPEFLKNEIDRFRNGGYQVWMDDFGSGYSSLNVLKDYSFDEIKLDMKFLSTFDENSKTIIKSVIVMAKELGIQTLAEGVETEEQLTFLREIGCEKAQGYYFSKPSPIVELRERGIIDREHAERRGWRRYYDSIGKINFITDRALSIVEYDGENFEYLFVNPAFKEVWKSFGITDEGIAYSSINEQSSVIYRQLRELEMSLHEEDEPRDIIYSSRGQYIRLTARCLSKKEKHSVFDVAIVNLTNKEEEKKREQLDQVFRMMYALYDSIYLIHLTGGNFEVIMRGASDNLPASDSFYRGDSLDELKAARLFIHTDDQPLFEKFIDLSTLEERFLASEKGYLVGYFRTKTNNGAYVWKVHTMLYVKETQDIIYCSRPAYFSQEGLIERVAPEYMMDSMYKFEQGYHVSLRKAIMESSTINLFWKDTERRFIGANKNFLQIYGIKDINELIGKTDEDMGWYVDNEPFKQDELDVIERGAVIRNYIGKSIIRGVSHNIMINKEPLYDNGKIVGLVGYFISMDQISDKNRMNLAQKMDTFDQVTGLMSAQGVVNQVAEYTEGWTMRKENFAVVRIFVREYHRTSQTYGEKLSKQMLYEIGQMIHNFFENRGVCARIFAGNFVVLTKCEDKGKLNREIEQLKREFKAVRTLAGYPETINPEMEIVFADETSDLHSMIGMASGGTALDIAERKKIEERLESYDIQMETIVNAIPGGIILHEMLEDGTSKIVYASEGTGVLSGRSTDKLKSDLDENINAGIFEQDVEYVQQAIEDAVYRGKELNVSYRIHHMDGSIIWLNMKGRVIGQENGHPLLLTVFHNISDTTKIYEDIIDEASVGILVGDDTTRETIFINQSAKNLVDAVFDGSVEKLHLAIRKADFVTEKRGSGSYEMEYNNRRYAIKAISSSWNGRKARVCYIVDITHKDVVTSVLSNQEHEGEQRVFLPTMEPRIYLSESECPGMCSHLMVSEAINLFWKDKDGKYQGANRGFLKTTQIDNVSDMIGKTEEELNLFKSDEIHKNIEKSVLTEGKASVGDREIMMISGKAHEIICTVEPVYHNGEVNGLFGYFEDLGETEDKQ